MARYTGPKHKYARREGVNIYGKASPSLERRLNILPGQKPGRRRRPKTTEYGLQLREKQKLKRMYGLMERQFANYVTKAEKTKDIATDEGLLRLLETRLDNVVYRMGFAKTRSQARQLVTHRHVYVNGERVNIPSYQVKEGDEVVVSEKISKNEILKKELEEVEAGMLDFVKRSKEKGKLVRMPSKEDVQNPVDYQLVIEFYSR